ncbi:MAG: GC-type dockerin domain-anchored protein [Planctomycetota bacterium]|nr:GC-type dockerin domain-anchored protein [Planctomycetota bacterium]
MLTAAQPRPRPRRVLSSMRVLLLAVIAIPAGQALSQPIVVSPQVRLSPGTEEWYECSVGVSQTNKDEVLIMAAPGPMRTAVVDWASGTAPVLSTATGNLDVFVTPHPTDGTIWYTSLDPNGPVTGWKSAGATTIPSGQIGTFSGSELQDKPGLAIGPWPGSPSGYRHYILRMQKNVGGGGCNHKHHEKVSYSDNADLGPGAWSWTEVPVEPDPNWPDPCHYLGWGAAPVVLDSGRIVAAIADEWVSSSGTWKYNFGKPYIVFSDDGGVDWKSDDPDSPIQIDPDNDVFPTTLNENCFNICPNTGCNDQDPTGAPCSTCGDTPMQVDRRKGAPSVAVDRTPEDPFLDHVYVAFYAKASENSSNTDLFIAKSFDGGATFDNNDLLHITDSMLGLTPTDYNPDQMVPALSIDSCGGVNVMFYDNRNDTNPNDCEYWVDVYYARITNFDTTPSISQWRLTPQSVRVDNLGSAFLGDYHNMTVSADGQTLYAAYISRNNANPTTGNRTCYLHRINLNCTGPASDFTGDGEVTEADLAAYLTEYSSGGMAADLDLDWVVDVNDFVTYIDWYNTEHGE